MSWLFFSEKDDPETGFPGVNKFNGDMSKWDVSRVTNMGEMSLQLTSFNGDLPNWDVSRVTNMEEMFTRASSFKQTLCGAWLTSTADKDRMFDGSSGRICKLGTDTSMSTADSEANYREAD